MTTTRVLLVLTSHDDLGGLGSTGYYVSEAAEPWLVFTGAGHQVDLASIEGGVPPEDGRDENNPAQQAFLGDSRVAAQLRDTPRLADVEASRYAAVFFVGGHGAMWDFPSASAVAEVGSAVYEADGIVAAVCHGPAALVNMTLSNGMALVAGKRVASFTNDEESAVGLTDVVPFLLADRLAERGATHVAAPAFTDHVVVDGRLITGQNPQSAAAAAREVVTALSAP